MSGPAPGREFEVWGQAVWRFLRPRGATSGLHKDPHATIVLFAISDISRQWLGWYQFSTDHAPDAQVLGYVTEQSAVKSARSSRLTTSKPMTVEELLGPILHARGGNPKPGSNPISKAVAELLPSSTSAELGISIRIAQFEREHKPTPLLLYFQTGVIRRDPSFLVSKFGSGFVHFIMSEPFSYPVRHLNVTRRLKIFRHNLTT